MPEQPKEIKFYLQRCHLQGGELQEYTAEEGMTWAEFCDSDYNTDGWYAYDPETDEDDSVETFYESGFAGAAEWGWIATEDHTGGDYREKRNNKIIPNHTYYEQFDSDAGISGGGWG